MIRNLLSKLFYAFISLLGVVSLVFFLFNVLPGDPAQMMMGQNERSEQLAMVKKKYGFDKSLSEQYFLYLNDLSPISIHSKNNDDYSYFNQNYSGIELFDFKKSTINIKFPYLRTSFVNQGKKKRDS